MNRQTVGIVAHVDAGKTTLSEALLYLGGALRKIGRVDHQNAFLDHHTIERERGITVFAKPAMLSLGEMELTLLDTPGHPDFSAEAERTMRMMDQAVLVISGPEGIQVHTETLWRLLERYQIPTWIFVNKTDLQTVDEQAVLEELKSRFGEGCIRFDAGKDPGSFYEQVALRSESMLARYIETGRVETADLIRGISRREIFPCYFGSAQKLNGIEELLQGFRQYSQAGKYPGEFGAKVYKIVRDEQGARLTFLKVTGGVLKVRMLIKDRNGLWEEKINQIRLYSGPKFKTVDEVPAGTLCAVTGLTRTYSGEGLGFEADADLPMLEAHRIYQMLLPGATDVFQAMNKLRQLEEEEPLIRIEREETTGEIRLRLMGEIQREVLCRTLYDRYGLDVEIIPYIPAPPAEEEELALEDGEIDPARTEKEPTVIRRSVLYTGSVEQERELRAIYERTYGSIGPKERVPSRPETILGTEELLKRLEPTEHYLLVDGYNILFAWDELKDLAKDDLDFARQTLLRILINYQAFRRGNLIVVFDAYKVADGKEHIEKQGGIYVVYTKEAELADTYIEKVTSRIAKHHAVRVATSDSLEQLITLGHGALRLSAQTFYEEVLRTNDEIAAIIEQLGKK